MAIVRAIEFDENRDVGRTVTAEPVSETIATLVDTVRAVYCNAARMTGFKQYINYGRPAPDGRSVQLGGDKVIQSGPNRGYTGFAALAHKLVQLRAPVDLYIRAQFEAHHKSPLSQQSRIPDVRTLCGPWAEANWEDYARNRKQAVVWQMQSDQAQLTVSILPMVVHLGWSEHEAVEYALGDMTGCVITPLTRYCTAFAHDMAHICEQSFRGALFQYLFESVYYDNILGSSIPEPLRETARTIRRNLGL